MAQGAAMKFDMEAIGFVRGGGRQATKDGWGDNRCAIELCVDRFAPDALAGLDQVSHLEVIFYFHLHSDEPTEFGARRPRNRADLSPVGTFAQRGRMRPNRLGVSICRILDLKPVWSGYLPRGELREPDWTQEFMAAYR
jgi:tRNA (Thr-GGU) A37 N-methylase